MQMELLAAWAFHLSYPQYEALCEASGEFTHGPAWFYDTMALLEHTHGENR